MAGPPAQFHIQSALKDLKDRTLVQIEPDLARLIYLASTRDYNTGRYYHDGLAYRFSQEAAEKALAQAHQEIFLDLALGPLEGLVDQLQRYFDLVRVDMNETIRAWERLEPYRVAIPVDSDPLTAALFFANVKIALAIVESRQPGHR